MIANVKVRVVSADKCPAAVTGIAGTTGINRIIVAPAIEIFVVAAAGGQRVIGATGSEGLIHPAAALQRVVHPMTCFKELVRPLPPTNAA